MGHVAGEATLVRHRAMLELCRLNQVLQLVMAGETQIRRRFAEQSTKPVVMRSVALGAGQFFCHCVVLELARFHVFLYLLVASVQAQLNGGPRQQRRIVGIMGSVALGAIFGCQMRLLFLSRHNDRAHLLVALLETQVGSRGVEQILGLAFMRSVTGQAFTLGNRLMCVFPGQHRLVAFITHFDLRALSYLGRFFRSVRIVAPQALSLRNRVVQHVSLGIHALMT